MQLCYEESRSRRAWRGRCLSTLAVLPVRRLLMLTSSHQLGEVVWFCQHGTSPRNQLIHNFVLIDAHIWWIGSQGGNPSDVFSVPFKAH